MVAILAAFVALWLTHAVILLITAIGEPLRRLRANRAPHSKRELIL